MKGLLKRLQRQAGSKVLRRAWGQKNHPLPLLNEMTGLEAFETTPWGQGGSPQAKTGWK